MVTTADAPKIEERLFADDGRVPNNPCLPLIIYRGALETGAGAAAACEARFAANGWSGGWRASIYAHHHYHSTAHEALGIVSGSARVLLGGDDGEILELHAGDAVVIPAGVAHKSETATPDFLVVGAYPGGRGPDMCTPGARDRERALANIATVPLPASDPIAGKAGPLVERWRAAVGP